MSASGAIGNLTPQQQQIVSEFNGLIYISDSPVQTGALWDSVMVPAGELFQGRYELFGKDSRAWPDTNMTQPNRLDAPEAFSIRRITFTFSATLDDRDIYDFAEAVIWRFRLGRKEYLCNNIVSLQTSRRAVAPIKICEFCQSVFVGEQTCPGCGARQFRIANGGEDEQPGTQFYLDLLFNIVIANQMSFNLDLEKSGCQTRATKDFKMWCHLEGLHAWGVS